MSRHTEALANYKNRTIDRIANLNPSLAAELREVRLDWYRIQNQADDGESATVFIYDEIGGSFGVDASEFVKEINDLDVKTLEVRINSPGGSLFDSIAIYNALVKHPAKVITTVDSLAASGASIIAMAGEEVVMMLGSQLMIHDALGLEMGNARDMEAMATFLNRQSDNIATIYAAKAGGSVSGWRDMMLAETWMFAEEAVNSGLATKVYEPPKDDETDEGDDITPVMPPTNSIDANELMKTKHTLDNRGYRYSGRSKAPEPKVSKRLFRNYVKSISK